MLAPYIDYTLLKPYCTEAEVEAFVQTALQYNFHSVCLPPYHIKNASAWLAHSKVKVCAVVGFPLGMHYTTTKLLETELCLQKGAQEIDLMMNLSAFKSGHLDYVQDEIAKTREQCAKRNAVLKVIAETGLLQNDELDAIAKICVETGVDFIKTSTGFVSPGAELDKVAYLRKILPATVKIKASGGIRTAEQARAFIEAGAERIGTSSLFID